MPQKLPLKNIKWTKKTPNIEKWDEKDEYGFILEVDLEYPETPHDYHSDYPLAPDIMTVNANMLSGYQKEIFKIYYGNKELKDEKTSKLILNSKHKENMWFISRLYSIIKNGYETHQGSYDNKISTEGLVETVD